jgi:predicted dehydrogenase
MQADPYLEPQEIAMTAITRRRFVQASAALPALGILSRKSSAHALGANDRVRIAVAGINGRGRDHIKAYTALPGVEVAYLVDPDTRLYDARSRWIVDQAGKAPECIQDIRRALDDKNVDAVSIATCNHWHALMTVWACQAGKDVYVEKPISHNVWEGRKCVEAARRYERIVQHGTQQRSMPERARQMAAIQSGKYGKLLVSKGYCCKPRWSIGVKPMSAPPQELDFDIWLGPAPQQDYHGNLVHYNWHWFWDFGNGDTGNQGVHEMDVARWAISGATLPSRVWSLGGRFGYEDQGQTPNTQLSVYEFGETLLVFETRGLVGKNDMPSIVANEFYTSDGVIRDWKFYPNGKDDGEAIDFDADVRVTPGGAFGSFVHAVRSRNPQDVNADAETGHYSSALCHLGNISYRLGETVPFRRGPQSLGDNRQVVEAFANIAENLAAVDVKLEQTSYRMGRVLELDAQGERFRGDDQANELLTRSYRKPFSIGETV